MQNVIDLEQVEQKLAAYDSVIYSIGEMCRDGKFNQHFDIHVDEAATSQQYEQIRAIGQQIADQFDVFVSVGQTDELWHKFGRELI